MVVGALAERDVEGGFGVELGVTGSTVVEVVPKMPATAFFWAAEGVGDEDEQAARTSAPRPRSARAARLWEVIAVDRPMSRSHSRYRDAHRVAPLPLWLASF
jgi:hypothetical protein